MDLQVVRDKRTGKTKGYGFVSFANPSDLALAFKEMNGMILWTCEMCVFIIVSLSQTWNETVSYLLWLMKVL